MGFKNGRIYRLDVITQTVLDRMLGILPWSHKVVVINLDSNDPFRPLVPYESKRLFKSNWEKVK